MTPFRPCMNRKMRFRYSHYTRDSVCITEVMKIIMENMCFYFFSSQYHCVSNVPCIP